MATDFASTWSEASPEVQRRITWAMCSRILIEKGTVTEVDVRTEVAPLLALAVHFCGPDRSRERGIELAGIRVDGLIGALRLGSV